MLSAQFSQSCDDQPRTTRELLDALGAADGEERRRVEEQVIRLNINLALYVAARYYGRGIPTEDLDQVACLGLVKAVRGYDPRRASDFPSYAVPTIRGELRRYFRDRGWTIRPPRSVQELQPRINLSRSRLWQALGRDPTDQELACDLGVDVDAVRRAERASGCFAPSSLDTAVGADDTTPVAHLATTERGYALVDARHVLRPLLRALTDRERRILQLRFWEGRTQAEIGAEIGVTQMQVSRLLSALFARLQHELREAS